MKSRTTVTIDEELIQKAKECKLNISNLAEMAIQREVNVFTKNHLIRALDIKIEMYEKFLSKHNLWREFETFKYGNL